MAGASGVRSGRFFHIFLSVFFPFFFSSLPSLSSFLSSLLGAPKSAPVPFGFVSFRFRDRGSHAVRRFFLCCCEGTKGKGNKTSSCSTNLDELVTQAIRTMQQPDSDRAKLGWFSYSFSPNQSQRNWFFLIRVAESVPGINTFYNFWLDDEEPPTTGAIKDILGSLATVITLLIGALATFVAAVDFDELTKHNLRFSKKVMEFPKAISMDL